MTIWTEKAIRMIRKAETKAYTMNHAELDPLHLLWAFLEGGPQVETMARTLDLDPDMVAKAAEQELGRMPAEENLEVSSPNDSLLHAIESNMAPSIVESIDSMSAADAPFNSDIRTAVDVRPIAR